LGEEHELGTFSEQELQESGGSYITKSFIVSNFTKY
jgi:hypothetical protein